MIEEANPEGHSDIMDRELLVAALLCVESSSNLPIDISADSIARVVTAMSFRRKPRLELITEELTNLGWVNDVDPRNWDIDSSTLSIPLRILEICNQLGLNVFDPMIKHDLDVDEGFRTAVLALPGGEFLLKRITDPSYMQLSIYRFLALFVTRRFEEGEVPVVKAAKRLII